MKSTLYGSCPVCKKNLHLDDKSNIRFCGKCHRQYYTIEERQKSDLGLQYDLETVSSESGSSPVLLSDEHDYRGFTEEYLQEKNDNNNYLTRHFPSHAKITSRVDYPS